MGHALGALSSLLSGPTYVQPLRDLQSVSPVMSCAVRPPPRRRPLCGHGCLKSVTASMGVASIQVRFGPRPRSSQAVRAVLIPALHKVTYYGYIRTPPIRGHTYIQPQWNLLSVRPERSRTNHRSVRPVVKILIFNGFCDQQPKPQGDSHRLEPPRSFVGPCRGRCVWVAPRRIPLPCFLRSGGRPRATTVG